MLISASNLGKLLLILLPVCSLISLSMGIVPVGLTDIVDPSSPGYLILWELRIPRLLITLIEGALLALSGAVIQSLFRNPLADPSLIGVTAGAGLASVSLLVLAGTWLSATWLTLALPMAAFFGGLVATWIVAKIGLMNQVSSVTSMLLAGIAINAIAASGVSLLQYLADDFSLRQTLFWLLGGVQQASWVEVAVLSAISVPVVISILRYSERLNLMMLGDQQAQLLGVDVVRIRKILIMLAALAVGAAVAVSGMIGFVGLVVPHWIRLLVGPDLRTLLPLCALFGAVFLLIADLCSRLVIAPAEIPLGIVTALVGGPFFLSMILYRRGQ